MGEEAGEEKQEGRLPVSQYVSLSGLHTIVQEFADDSHAARRKYKKDLDHLNPDLVAYNRQKEIAMGLAPGTLVRQADSGEGSSLQVRTNYKKVDHT